ncbi:MAG: hypothetical protein U0Y68_19160 [Blastocatellia bacterium]
MKLIYFAFLLLTVPTFAQTLTEKSFRFDAEAEALLHFQATSPGANWAVKGSEAATVTIEVDGHYNQDVILFGGAQQFDYRILLGRLAAGEHRLRVALNAAQSSANAKQAVIQTATVTPQPGGSDLAALALAHAPILYARPDTVGQFSDVPVLMWYEVIREGAANIIRYSIIFTNEDGGTQTAALMARWGRVTDIEWICEVKFDAQGKVLGESFQGTSHRTLPFTGRHEAAHPVYIVASRNNNFSDQLPTPLPALRFAPAPVSFDTAQQSREALMDRQSWTYRLMYDEMLREGKIATDAEVVGAAGLGIKMLDPRRYLYFDGSSTQTNAALSFAVKLKGDARWYTSDLGNSYFRIDRSGWFRSTVRLPKISGVHQIEKIAVRCEALPDTQSRKQDFKPEPTCAIDTLSKVFLLNENFAPAATLPLQVKQTSLRFGEMLEVFPSRK